VGDGETGNRQRTTGNEQPTTITGWYETESMINALISSPLLDIFAIEVLHRLRSNQSINQSIALVMMVVCMVMVST
jgi:hypothetical protein